ncbi:nuclease A inhibitor family protein (plasmid) [Kovacikia minuta CCNUW1]|uniref:nuclease A inhibitor family protein n=1 Tax=Kovacikia minuta TaxID=2931930 RepID=UPI001CC9E3BA|nr:nuclease A inhibitor family protein [Kovacikia minuta]UBF30787.1 nuclease A inhibitor family protein [Kovacikia minuta CCNUW1]
MSDFKTDIKVISILRQAVNDLLWMSESEYPIDILEWNVSEEHPFTVETLLQATQHSPDGPIQQLTIEALFEPLMQEQDWFGPEEHQRAQRFQSLYQLLQERLSEIQVYRIGTIEVDIYILGKVTSTKLIGLHTRLVET